MSILQVTDFCCLKRDYVELFAQMKLGRLFRRTRAVLDTTLIVHYFFFAFPVSGTGIWRELSVNFMPLFQRSI